MSNVEIATKLFEELDAYEHVHVVASNPETTNWDFSVEDGTVVHVHLNAESGQLIFTVGLGPMPAGDTLNIHQLLLQANFVWCETSGLFGALDDKKEPVLMFRCPLLGTQLSPLLGLFNALAVQHRTWTDMIHRNTDDTNAPNSGDGIRV